MQSRSGELAMRPLPAVLLDLHEGSATGKLVLRRGRVVKTIDLVQGTPVSAASTQRDETLGHFLVSTGVISEAQHQEAVSRAARLGGKLGEALVTLNALSSEKLVDQLGKQARHKLVQALRWPQGAWRFDPSTQGIEGVHMSMVDLVLGGLRDTAGEDLGRLARLDGMTFELTSRGLRLRAELKRTFGEPVLVGLANAATMQDIEQAFGARMPARVAIDALLMCDAVVSKSSAVGLGTVVPISRTTLAGYAAVRDKLPQEITEALRDAPPLAPLQKPARADSDDEEESLYDRLFDDDDVVPGEDVYKGAAPLEFEDEDSGVVSADLVATATALSEQTTRARQAIAAEFQRIQGADLYAILLVERDATREDVEDGYQVKLMMFDRASAPGIDGMTRPKVEDIRAAYAKARTVLSDPRKRTAYDRELAGGELTQAPPALDTELSFRMAEQHMAKGQWPQAIGLLKTVIAKAPDEADYHAALGWAQWHAGQSTPAAGDAARGHLNHALSINPDHAAAHDYTVAIDALLRVDDAAAIFHLERALDLDPQRTSALAAVEQVLVGRGDLRQLERVLKRVLFRLRGKGPRHEAIAWARLARLYFEHLDNPQGGTAAATNARKLAPDDAEVLEVVQRAETASRNQVTEPVRTGWREALADPHSGAELVRTAQAAGHADTAFLAAATMVALGTADQPMQALYEQHRVRMSSLPSTPLGRDEWALLRHKDDTIELGALVELVAPAIHALAPMTLADSDLDASQRIADNELPQVFSWLRVQLGALLGVGEAPVYSRSELGTQIHVVACDPPVLVAGDDALTAPERPELVFRLARALTFLWPGRAVGSSRPGRVLRAVVSAVVREAAGTELGADDPLAAKATAALDRLSNDVRTQARATALRLMSRHGGGMNLSLWSRSLVRTADRAGMLLCGDIPAAFQGAREMSDLDKDLIEFAYSAAHVRLRTQLGMSKA
jgi:tetratricopeptide (TPR) repeat protein